MLSVSTKVNLFPGSVEEIGLRHNLWLVVKAVSAQDCIYEFEMRLCSRGCGRLAKQRSDECCTHCPAGHTRCCQYRAMERELNATAAARASASGPAAAARASVSGPDVPRSREAQDPEPEPPPTERAQGPDTRQGRPQSSTPRGAGRSTRGHEGPSAAENDIFLDAREADDPTSRLLQVIAQHRAETERLNEGIARLQATIQRLRMDVYERDARIAELLGHQAPATFRIGQEVTESNFVPGYLVTALHDPPAIHTAGGFGLYTMTWEMLERTLGVTAGRLQQRGCSLRKVSTLRQALDIWRAAGHRGPITRVG